MRTLLQGNVFFGAHRNIWMKIDAYWQQQKRIPVSLVSGIIRFIQIVVGVPTTHVRRVCTNFCRTNAVTDVFDCQMSPRMPTVCRTIMIKWVISTQSIPVRVDIDLAVLLSSLNQTWSEFSCSARPCCLWNELIWNRWYGRWSVVAELCPLVEFEFWHVELWITSARWCFSVARLTEVIF